MNALPAVRRPWLARSIWDLEKSVPPTIASMAPVCGTMLTTADSGSAGGRTPGWGRTCTMALRALLCIARLSVVSTVSPPCRRSFRRSATVFPNAGFASNSFTTYAVQYGSRPLVLAVRPFVESLIGVAIAPW